MICLRLILASLLILTFNGCFYKDKVKTLQGNKMVDLKKLDETIEVEKYNTVKQEALNRGYKTLIEYHKFKDEFVKGLNERAQLWKHQKASN